MNKQMRQFIINQCPDIEALKRILTRVQLKRIDHHFIPIPAEDIQLGEKDKKAKGRIVDKYFSDHKDKLEIMDRAIQCILDNSEAFKDYRDRDDVREDMLFRYLAYGFQPDEYLCYGLYNQEPEVQKKWISDYERYVIIYSINDIKDIMVFNNKVRTYEVFRDYYKRETISIKTERDYPRFEAFAKKHPVFVKKLVYKGGGRSVELVDSRESSLEDLFRKYIDSGECIIEERIFQNQVMSALNPSSVNTVRCITVNTRNGIRIPYTFLKVGRNGSFIDNGAAGGILVGINVQDGVADTIGYDEVMNTYTEHPDTKVQFMGYRFPQWDEMKALCIKMAGMTPRVKCIGWDMALCDDGWVVVEGNGETQFIGPQIVYRRGIKRELMTLMDEVEPVIPIELKNQ